MAWSTPPTFTAGNVVTEAQMDILSDDLTFLGGPPRCRVYNSAAFSHNSSGNWLEITFNSERYDTDTMHSTAVNTGRITATTAGTYLVGVHFRFTNNGTGVRIGRLLLNGATPIAELGPFPGNATHGNNFTIVTSYALAATNYITAQAWQDSGGSLDVSAAGNSSPEFWAHLLAVA